MMIDRYRISSLEPRELISGHHGRVVHSAHTTHVYWKIDAGAQLPEHNHPHEQVVNVLEGKYELVVNGETYVLEAGEVLVVPGGATHSGTAHTDCRILDVFSPVREEYR
jgi:quercetin dioxygenase-like cupin family protein